MKTAWKALAAVAIGGGAWGALGNAADPPRSASVEAVAALFAEWRAFEAPPLRDGAPDYTKATVTRSFTRL